MKLTYISHASLLLETETSTIVTDPWYFGSAYFGQWHVFPKPVDTSFVERVTHLILTHGHEDHFHIPTLQKINKNAKVYFPYTWKSGCREILQSIGFTNIEEVQGFKKVAISNDVFLTFVINGLDAFAIYEFAGLVFLNLNDALNASHKNYLKLFSNIIKTSFPVVDYMISGLGGASYFPNTVHSPLKNDYEIGLLREQFLAHKFCELLNEIKPKNVIPFVPGFALLEKDKQWINEIRFPRKNLETYYKDNFDKSSTTNFLNLLPGDFVDETGWVKSSSYHGQNIEENINKLVVQQYSNEIAALNIPSFKEPHTIRNLAINLNILLANNNSGISNNLLEKVNFGIQFTDIKEELFIHCYYSTNGLKAEQVSIWPKMANLKITTQTNKLAFAIKEEWGGDVFYIGYGADIDILDQSCLKDNLDIVSLRLLSRFPAASYHMLREPIRAAKYLINNPKFARLALKQKVLTRGNPNKLPYNERAHWINKSKCDVCKLCDIPLLTDEFAESLNFI